MALGAQPGTITIYTFSGLPHGHASSTRLGRDDATPHSCPIATVDEYVDRIDGRPIALMKIDVEGHELDVLRGASTFLAQPDAPIVSFEVNIECLTDRDIEPEHVAEALRRHDYSSLWRVEGDGSVRRCDGELAAHRRGLPRREASTGGATDPGHRS